MLHRLNPAPPEAAAPPAVLQQREVAARLAQSPRPSSEPKPTFAKVFHWRLPAGETRQPKTVEIIGSFTDWQRVPLQRADGRDAWSVTVPDIAAHRTHHYMLLVDGLPAPDRNCDGLAKPDGPQELQYALNTPRGPRLFMLFAQTK